jgi:hypothetical protein
MEPTEFCRELIPAVTLTLELGFSLGVNGPRLGPIALLRQAVCVHKEIVGGLAIEACEAQEDEHKQGRGVVGTEHSASDACSGSSTHSDEDHSYLPALYAARIGQRDKNFHKILSKVTKDFSGPGVGSEGPRQFQNSTSFLPFDSGSSN